MKLGHVLKGLAEISGPTTGYLGRSPAMQSVYNWGYKGYYAGGGEEPKVELDLQQQNMMIDQAIDLLYSQYPEVIENKKLKRHVLQVLIGKVTQGELKDKIDMDDFIKRLKKTKGVETV